MSKRKFQKGDYVKLSPKAPKYITKILSQITYTSIRVRSYGYRYDRGAYICELLDANDKVIRNGRLKNGDEIVLDTSHISLGTVLSQADTISTRINENVAKIEELQKENQSLIETLNLMEELGVKTFNEKAYTVAKKMIATKRLDMPIKSAYNVVAELSELL